MARERGADAMVERIAARQHHDALAAPLSDRGQRVGKRALPSEGFAQGLRHQGQMAAAADNKIGAFDQRARRAGKPAPAILANSDHRQPGAHDGPMSALTAAAASALPPRRPLSAMKGMPQGFCTSAAFASAAPTKPTGNPSISAGFGAPVAISSRRWKSAVGAFPIATTAPSRWGCQSSTAAAERVVLRRFARAGTRLLLSVQRAWRLVMPAATIDASTR